MWRECPPRDPEDSVAAACAARRLRQRSDRPPRAREEKAPARHQLRLTDDTDEFMSDVELAVGPLGALSLKRV